MSSLVVQPGDVGFSRDLVGFPAPEWWIRFAESRKYGRDQGAMSPSHWNHTWMVTGDDAIIQATPNGMERGKISWYVNNPKQRLMILRPHWTHPEGPAVAVQAMEKMLGQPYAFGSIFSDALSLVFNSTLRIGFINRHTCSGAVAHALVCSGLIDMDFEEWASPADVLAALPGVSISVLEKL